MVGIAQDGIAALVERLRDALAQGEELPAERELAERWQVKRHQLRAALQRLRAAGEMEPARAGRRPSRAQGSSQHLASGTNPVEIVELRMIIEPALARLAALRASPVEIARIQRAANPQGELAPGLADLAFHRAVAAGARNGLAVQLYGLLRQLAADTRLRFGDRGPACPQRLGRRDAEHRAIAEAIAQRNPAAAEEAMRIHLAAVQRQILDRLAPGASAA